MTNIYDTSMYPLGSTKPKVVANNASNFDEATNSEQPWWTDRFGNTRLTWKGAEFQWNQMMENIGFEPVHLVYVDGFPLVVSRPTQLFDRAGITYKIKQPATFPYTLTGTWATDQNNVVQVADASIRSDLANTSDATKGSALVGWKSTAAGSVGRPLSKKLDGDIDVTDFGADPTGVLDSWAAFEAARLVAESRQPAGAEQHAFPRIWVPAGTYSLSKPVWFRKAHRIDGGGARIVAMVGFAGQTVPKAGGGTEVVGAMFIFLDGAKGTTGVDPQWGAVVGRGITLDAQFRTNLNIYTERMAYATFDCELQASSQDGLQVGPWSWGLKVDGLTVENFGRYGIAFLENAAANGISIATARIWGRFTEPTAGIFFDLNAQCYGVSISGGFIEKLLYGVLISAGNGPMSIDGVDFEQCRNGCVRAAGSLIGGQGIGTISIRNSLLHSIEGPKVFCSGGRIDVEGCRLGLPSLPPTVDFDTGADGIITYGHNEFQGNVPGINAEGLGSIFGRSVNPTEEVDDSYIAQKSVTPTTTYARRLHQYKDSPYLQSGGLSWQSAYPGGASGQYVSQSDWFVTEYLHVTTPGVPSKVIGVRLSTFGGSSAFKPTTTGVVMCGEAGASWAGGSTTVAFTVTSDRRVKTDEAALEDAELRAAVAIKGLFKKFKLKQEVATMGANAKLHVGVMAQDVCEAFTAEGLDWRQYKIVELSTWEDQPEMRDKDGVLVSAYRAAGDLYSVNYEQLLAFVIAAI